MFENRSKETSFLFLVHPYGANHFRDLPSLRTAFETCEHGQAIHQGTYEDGTPFRIVMASK